MVSHLSGGTRINEQHKDHLGLVPLEQKECLDRVACQHREPLLVFGTERHRDDVAVFLLVLVGGDRFELFEGCEVVDLDDGCSLGALSHSQEFLLSVDGHACDGFGSFDAWNVGLGLVLDGVLDDVVADRVDHRLLVVDEVKVVDDVVSETGHELGTQLHVGPRLLLGLLGSFVFLGRCFGLL